MGSLIDAGRRSAARVWKRLCIAVVAAAPIAVAQAQPPLQLQSFGKYLRASSVPSAARSVLRALGDRLSRPGKERVVSAGMFSDGHGERRVQFIWELPGRFRFDDGGPQPRFLLADGKLTPELSDQDRAVIESLTSDTAEFFLYAYAHGKACRLLGRRFAQKSESGGPAAGAVDDVFELLAGDDPAAGVAAAHKMFFFDSGTKLLRSVRYKRHRQGAPVLVETVFSGWSQVQGQFVPYGVTRFENGQTVFSFRCEAAAIVGAAGDGLFVVR